MSGEPIHDGAFVRHYFSERPPGSAFDVTGAVKFRTLKTICCESKLTESAKSAAAVLLDCLNTSTGKCYPSANTIARRTGISVPSVRRGLSLLAAHGWVRAKSRVTESGGYDSNQYDVAMVYDNAQKKRPEGGAHR